MELLDTLPSKTVPLADVDVKRILAVGSRANEVLMATNPLPLVATHNDLVPANIIDDGVRLHLIDWEYGGIGDRMFDLGNLAEMSDYTAQETADLLRVYLDLAEAQQQLPEHLLARVWLSRFITCVREGMWGLVQDRVQSMQFSAEWTQMTSYSDYARDYFLKAQALLSADGTDRVSAWIAALQTADDAAVLSSTVSDEHTAVPRSAGLPLQQRSGKQTWPELVGKSFDVARKQILSDFPDAAVFKVAEGSMVTMDFRLDRVRVTVNSDDIVLKTPRVG
eukprot:TRINITY_DN5674_c0_g2_i4.p1 TRINITY_DN5674_c0_g2~~TRINITY_DN5674_c0_g2_i4.p1  ORF type:complete len:279 (-),score=76.46 TRINITY_DN5674_c0_g2_i4:227-1063(-)